MNLLGSSFRSFFVLSLATTAPQDTLLDVGLRHYWNGEYEATVDALDGNCAALSDAGERIECLSYLAFSQIALAREEPSRATFVELLTLDPGYRLDTELVSPKILARFEDAANELADEWFEEAKASYAASDYPAAIRGLDRVLLLAEDHELAREYRELCRERMELETKLAEASAPPPAAEEPSREAEPDEDRVYHVDSEIARPVLLVRVDPEYPRLALMRRIEGSVVVSVVIDETGSVRDWKVLRSVSESIDEAALDAVSKWRYRPATRNGVPVAVYGVVQLHFELES